MPNLFLPIGYKMSDSPGDIANRRVIARMYGGYNVRGPFFYPRGPFGGRTFDLWQTGDGVWGLGALGYDPGMLELCQTGTVGGDWACAQRNQDKIEEYYCAQGSVEDCRAQGMAPPVSDPTFQEGFRDIQSMRTVQPYYTSTFDAQGNVIGSTLHDPTPIYQQEQLPGIVWPTGSTGGVTAPQQTQAQASTQTQKPNQSVPPAPANTPASPGFDNTAAKLLYGEGAPVPPPAKSDNMLMYVALAGLALLAFKAR